MKVLDFSRSFLTFRIDTTRMRPTTVTHAPPFKVNNARVHIDCYCVITEKATGATEAFVLGASCKTERVNVAGDIWTEPNADFVPILSNTQFMQIKTYDRVGVKIDHYPASESLQPERQVSFVADAFDDTNIELCYRNGELLDSNDAIAASTLRGDPLLASTELENDRYRAVIEYPIKTMNVSPDDGFYQTDTGPIILPDLSRDLEDLIGGMELAFSAFNNASWVELLVRWPTTVADGVDVYHYSRVVRYDDVRNQIFRLTN